MELNCSILVKGGGRECVRKADAVKCKHIIMEGGHSTVGVLLAWKGEKDV